MATPLTYRTQYCINVYTTPGRSNYVTVYTRIDQTTGSLSNIANNDASSTQTVKNAHETQGSVDTLVDSSVSCEKWPFSVQHQPCSRATEVVGEPSGTQWGGAFVSGGRRVDDRHVKQWRNSSKYQGVKLVASLNEGGGRIRSLRTHNTGASEYALQVSENNNPYHQVLRIVYITGVAAATVPGRSEHAGSTTIETQHATHLPRLRSNLLFLYRTRIVRCVLKLSCF